MGWLIGALVLGLGALAFEKGAGAKPSPVSPPDNKGTQRDTYRGFVVDYDVTNDGVQATTADAVGVVIEAYAPSLAQAQGDIRGKIDQAIASGSSPPVAAAPKLPPNALGLRR